MPPRSRRRRQRLSGDEREQAILAAADKLFTARPLHQVSIDDLAQEAGISRPTFYFYFQSKDAVLLALLDRVVADARRERDEALDAAGDDPMRAWRAVIEAFARTWSAHRSLIRAAEEARVASPEVRDLWATVMEQLVEETAVAIELERSRAAAPAGPPARDLAACLVLMNERVLSSAYGGLRPAPDEDGLVDTLLGVWLGAIYQAPAAAHSVKQRARKRASRSAGTPDGAGTRP